MLRPAPTEQQSSRKTNIAVWIGLVIIALMLIDPFMQVYEHDRYGPHLRQMSCASNYKQLGLSLTQYAQDNDGNAPMAADPHSSKTWRETLFPCVKSTAIYVCLEDHRDYSHASPDHLPVSYGANVIKGGRGMFASPGSAPIRYNDVAETIALVDMRGYQGPEWSMVDAAFLPTTGRELYVHKPYHAFFEHPAGQYNCFFADGHVKFLKPMDTLTPVNLWTRDNRPFTGQEWSNAQAILRHAEAE